MRAVRRTDPLRRFRESGRRSSARSPDAKLREHRGTPRSRLGVDVGVEAATGAVHRDLQRAEAANAELPQALRIEIVEVDVLARLDPRRLERGDAADDRKVDAAELAERGERARTHA